VRALIVVGDNPAMFAHGQERVKTGLRQLDCLIVIDSLPTDTANLADVAFADLPVQGKDGTYTNADRRLLRLSRAESATGDQRDCLETLNALAGALSARMGRTFASPGQDAAAVMDTIAQTVPGYGAGAYSRLESGETRVLTAPATRAELQPVSPPALPQPNGSLVLTTSRSLYTSRDGASIHSSEADKLHREEFLELNPEDAARMGIGQNRPVLVSNGSLQLTLSAALTDAVAPGSAYLPLYFDGGVVNSLISADAPLTLVTVRPV